MLKLFRNIRNRVMPLKKFAVQVSIWEEHSQQYIGRLTVTTDARHPMGAKRNVKESLRLHVTNAKSIKG